GPGHLGPGPAGLPSLGGRLRPGGGPDGLGPAAVRRQPERALRLVPSSRVQLLHGRLAGAVEPLLLKALRVAAMTSPLGLFRLADDLLRGEPTPELSSRSAPAAALLLLILGFGMFYGGVMGTYGGLGDDRPLQLVYSAIKVPFLILMTFVLSVPSFYVVNT